MVEDKALAARLLGVEIGEFYADEAELLDNRRYDEWLGLLDEEIRYRMPLTRNVRRAELGREFSGEKDINWFDEGIQTLRQRVAQIKTGFHWAEEPPSRVSHLITNVRLKQILPSPQAPEQLAVSSRFLVYQNRLETETSILVGKREDLLVRRGDGWKIAQRTIYLDQNVLLAKALTIFL